VARPALPSIDLVVATVGRTTELDALLTSLGKQSHKDFRVLVVDQNDDDRAGEILAGHSELFIERLRSPRGLSRARNVGLERVASDLVAFPDDDCTYGAGLLEDVARRFAGDASLDGLTGRTEDAAGGTPASSKRDSTTLTDDNLWNRGSSAAMFLRTDVVRRVGSFDESLGVGSGTLWSSAEEIDYLVRAVRGGARIVYDPVVTVGHALRVDDPARGFRDGASVGYLLRKHRYPPRVLARMLVRPVGGAVVALAHRDVERSQYYVQTLRGRIRGYLASSASNSSA
jgi:glycosyltransferase involved in cell wall biosynthesis